jgi:uncharacterized Zn finger protein
VSLPEYTEVTIRQQASADSFQRGREYCRSGAVVSLVQREATLEAAVWGSDTVPYRVQVTFGGDRLGGATCTCPYDWGGWCKHIVAALLAAREQPEQIQERQPVAEMLAGLSRDQLQAILLKLIQIDPGVVNVIEAQVPFLAPTPTSIATSPVDRPQTARPTVDRQALRRQVRSLLSHGGGGRRSWHGHGSAAVAVSAVSGVITQAEQLIVDGDGHGALAVLEILTAELLAAWEGLDDSDGESPELFEELGCLLTEALLTDELTAKERQAWPPKIKAWQRTLSRYGIDNYFEPAGWAAEHGWDDAQLQRVLQGEITRLGAWEGEAPFWADELAEAQLNVLDRQGRHQEYLYLAEAEGQTVRYLTMLTRLGRGDEALTYSRTYLRSVSDAFALSIALWERGEIELSLESAEVGLTREGPKGGLASWLRDRAAEQGQTSRAVAAARIAFDEQLNLSDYLKIQELAGPDWPDQQPPLLDRLRKVRSHYPQGPVEIFLHEGLIDDAIAVVDQGATHALVEQVVDAASTLRPDWVIDASRKQAEGLMNDGKSQYYGSAVRWLARARDVYRATGREQEWQSYLAGLLDRHARKYSLVPLLKALK